MYVVVVIVVIVFTLPGARWPWGAQTERVERVEGTVWQRWLRLCALRSGEVGKRADREGLFLSSPDPEAQTHPLLPNPHPPLTPPPTPPPTPPSSTMTSEP